MNIARKLGWRPDTPDQRDYKFVRPKAVRLPKSVDLRPMMPPIYDQGELGSCTANAIATAYTVSKVSTDVKALRKVVPFLPSRLFIYYNEREMEGTISEDAGAEIRDGIKSVNKLGCCLEDNWPYKISQFTKKPPKARYTEAKKHQALLYRRIDNSRIADIKAALAESMPVVCGFMVYESMDTAKVAKSGIVPMPKKSEYALGGHAVLIVGYSDSTKRFLCRNSWGEGWGLKGYFWMPYAYLTNTNLADDFWVISASEG